MSDQANPVQGAERLFYPQPEAEEPDEPTEVEGAETLDIEPAEEEAAEELDADEFESEEGEDVDQADDVYELDGETFTIEEFRQMKKQQMLERDYTQKRMADAKREKANIEREAQLNNDAKRLQSMLSDAEAVLNDLQQDGYLSDSKIQEKKERLQAARQKAEQDAAESNAAISQTENALLLNRFPEWMSDGNVTDAYKNDMAIIDEYLRAEEFSQEDVQRLATQKGMHKFFTAFLKAAKYDGLQKKTAAVSKKLKTVPVATKPKKKPAPVKKRSAADVLYGKN